MPMPQQKPGHSKQTYATPMRFIQSVMRRLGINRFAHDFAADHLNTQAATYFDEQRDALSVACWADFIPLGTWGWLNPPFAKIGLWAKKCVEVRDQGRQIALLVPAGVGANWFRDYVDGHALVLALNGRLPFMPDKPKWLYPKDCILALYSPKIQTGFEVWSWATPTAQRLAA